MKLPFKLPIPLYWFQNPPRSILTQTDSDGTRHAVVVDMPDNAPVLRQWNPGVLVAEPTKRPDE